MRALVRRNPSYLAELVSACLIAAGFVGASNAPGAVANGRHESIQVNRVHKGDRQATPPIRRVQPMMLPWRERPKPSFEHPPLGCDPTFSPIVEPAKAAIYQRCLV